MTKHVEGAVEWRPEWHGEDREKFDRLVAAYSEEISLMRSVRKALDLSQVETARILEMTQPNVSKLELRGDPSLSVLRKMVEAKGGTLELTVKLPEGKELAFAL